MNITHLEYFLAAVRSGSFASAAKEEFVTPQAISKAVCSLERELGVTLLIKDSRGVRPTRAGLEAAHRGMKLLADVSDLKREVRACRGAQSEP